MNPNRPTKSFTLISLVGSWRHRTNQAPESKDEWPFIPTASGDLLTVNILPFTIVEEIERYFERSQAWCGLWYIGTPREELSELPPRQSCPLYNTDVDEGLASIAL